MNRLELLDRLRSFPDFAPIPEQAATEIQSEVHLSAIKGQELFAAQGGQCRHFLILLSGQARIFTMSAEGREITLSHLDPGVGCVIAAACCIGGDPLPCSVTIEAAGEGLLIPPPLFRRWVEDHTFWRDYVFKLIASQLGQVVAITNELAFDRLDARIASHLVRQATRGQRLESTHQDVALELGTSRAVVSRILKEFEQEGLVTLQRGAICLRNFGALTERAGLSGFGNLSS
jgi:CRP/FNR family transcriptional regulator